MLKTDCVWFTTLRHGLNMYRNKACVVVNGTQLKSVAASLECGLMEEERSRSQDEVGSGGPGSRGTARGMLEFSMAGVEKGGREGISGCKSRSKKTTGFGRCIVCEAEGVKDEGANGGDRPVL